MKNRNQRQRTPFSGCVGFGYALVLLGVEEAVVLLGIDAQNVVGCDFRTYAIHPQKKQKIHTVGSAE